MTALQHHANRGTHANTLDLQGYFKKQLSSTHKKSVATNSMISVKALSHCWCHLR
ncbi:YbgA family protein [Vibrio fortis]|uniref:YbgA family protein n=1 Tax=Vibrio fortis TaxID=212667 RepID=UPI0021E67156|nr:YbgA family protein [Vibrio fortis]